LLQVKKKIILTPPHTHTHTFMQECFKIISQKVTEFI
jgi:hypothetical protein